AQIIRNRSVCLCVHLKKSGCMQSKLRKMLTETVGAGQQSERIADIIDEKELLRRIPICRRTAKNLPDQQKLPYIALNGRILYDWPCVRQALLRLQVGGAR